MAPARQCPHKHSLAAGTRICLTCGWEAPLSDFITTLAGHEILNFQEVFKRKYYLVSYQEHEYVLSESLEFLSLELRQKAYQKLAQRSDCPVLDYFHHQWDGVVYLYTRLPRATWDLLQLNLRQQLNQSGLLPEETLMHIVEQWQSWQRFFQEQKIVQPHWALPLLAHDETGMLHILNLDALAPDSDLFLSPTVMLGYHSLLPHLNPGLSSNYKLQQSSLFSSIYELLCGLSPVLWYPEPIRLNGFKRLFRGPAWDVIQRFDGSQNLPLIKDLYQKDNLSSVCESNQAFFKAQRCFEQKDYSLALLHLEKAQELFKVSTHIPGLQAKCTFAQGLLKSSLQSLESARRCDALANQYFLQAQVHLEAQDIYLAMAALNKAIEKSSHYPEAYQLLATCHEKNKEFQKAELLLNISYKQRKSSSVQAQLSRIRTQKMRKPDTPLSMKGGTSVYLGDRKKSVEVELITCSQGHQMRPENVQCSICHERMGLKKEQQIENYRIQKILSPRQKSEQGTKGGLYLAEHSETSEKFVLKEFLVYHYHAEFKDKFDYLQTLKHPNLLPLKEILFDGSFAYFVMPYFVGESLADFLHQHGLLPGKKFKELLMCLADLIHYLHSQPEPIIHADVKPENILVTRTGRFYLLDLESLFLQNRHIRRTARPFTYPYSPPELPIMKIITLTTDSFAFGRTLIHAATGILPDLFYDELTQRLIGWEQYAQHLPNSLLDDMRHLSADHPKDRLKIDKPLLQRWHRLPSEFEPSSDDQQILIALINRVLALEPHQQSQMETAVAKLLKHTRNSMTCFLAASAYYKVGLLKLALQMATISYRLQPKRVQSAWLAANLASEQGEFKLAINLINKLEPEYFEHETSLLILARNYRKLKSWLPAEQAYLRLGDLKPLDTLLQLEIAGFYLESNLLTHAENSLRHLLEQGLSSHLLCLTNHMLGQVLAKLGKLKEAQDVLEQAFQIYSDRPELLYDLALVCFTQKKWQSASYYYSKCLEFWPDKTKLKFDLAICHLECKKFAKALAELNDLIPNEEVNEHAIQFQKARALTLLYRFDEAEAIYRHLLQQKQEIAVYVNLVNLYLIIEQTDLASQILLEGHRLFPDSPILRKLKLSHLQTS